MKELTIHLLQESHNPLYEQIYQYIKNDIAEGKLFSGEKLPSTRLLAKHLQVSRSTVALAYDQLLSEGYIMAVPSSGYYVCEIEGLYQNIQSGKESLYHNHKEKINNSAHMEKGKEEVCYQYDFSPNTVEWSEFSMNAWQKAVKKTLQEEMKDLFFPGSALGEENLRQVICNYIHQARGVRCSIHQIIIGAGNEYLLMLLSQILHGLSGIAMESPTYGQAYETFCNLGWQVSTISMDKDGISIPLLKESKAKLVYVMPSHQFPLGTVMPFRRRRELLNWAGEVEGRYIIEDDYDSEFRYKGKPIPSLQGSDPFSAVIYLGTFSKSIAPAVRVSYMVLPPKLMEMYHKHCGFYSSTVSRMQQQTLYHFMKAGYFERHLNKMRGIYRGRHDALLNALKGKGWVNHIYGEKAGLHILVETKTGKAESEVVNAAKRMGLRVYGLDEYVIEEDFSKKNPVLLLGYAGLDEEKIYSGIEKLNEIMIF